MTGGTGGGNYAADTDVNVTGQEENNDPANDPVDTANGQTDQNQTEDAEDNTKLTPPTVPATLPDNITDIPEIDDNRNLLGLWIALSAAILVILCVLVWHKWQKKKEAS